MQKKYVIANFKMNKVDSEVKEYVSQLLPKIEDATSQVVLAVPSVSIKTAVKGLKDSPIIVASQNINENNFGAFTGEINADMVAKVGAEAVIVGHSERRALFKETDAIINKKIQGALKAGLMCVFCFGEMAYDKKNNLTETALTNQITGALNNIYGNELNHIIFAYEPIWAIGTGVVATNAEIEKTIKLIRQVITNLYDEKVANNASIVYGGSVNENNVKDIAKISNLNGVLVGGASLNSEKFATIVNAFGKKATKK
jgi:triosephosphate isomerase (TIM)